MTVKEPTQREMIEGIYRAFSSFDADTIKTFVIQQKSINEDVSKNRREIFGNGKEGIRDCVRDLKRDMKVIKWIVGVAAGAFIATGIGIWATGIFS